MPDLRCHLVCNICANGVCRQFSSSLVVLDSSSSFVAGLAPNCCNYTFYANRPRAVFSCFSSVFFPRIRAVCVSLALYIVPPKKTVVSRGPYIIQYPHGSGNGGGNTGLLTSNRLKPLPLRFFAYSLLSSKWFSG